MPKIVLNEAAAERLTQLIDAGSVDASSEWAFTGEDADRLLGDPADWGFYAKHFLGIDEDAQENTRGRYVYPFARLVGDVVTVYGAGLAAIQTEAAAAGDAKIESTASASLERTNPAPTEDGAGPGGDVAPAPPKPSGDGRPLPGQSAVEPGSLLYRCEREGTVFEIRSGDVVYREATVERREIDVEKRLVPLTFSSEAAVDRGWCQEILDHSPGSVRMHRLQNKAAVLVQHTPENHVGVVTSAEITTDRLGRAWTRFGRSEYAQGIFDDILDEIRCHVSVGYRIYAVQERNLPGGGLELRVVDWEPFEISIVAIPADANKQVGVERAFGHALPHVIVTREEGGMPEAVLDREAIQKAERERARMIREIGQKYNLKDFAERHAEAGTAFDEFRLLAFEELGVARKVTHDQMREETKIGMSPDELGRYSIFRAIQAHISKDWSKAGLEAEAARTVQDRTERPANGFYVPYDVLAGKRDINIADGSGQNAAGASLLGTDHLAGSMIDMLRPASVLARLGVRVLDGLTGNIEIPRRDTGATFYVINNETTGVTESTPTFGLVTASPKTVAARVDITRRMLMQGSPAVEGLTRDDLMIGMGLKFDSLGLTGSGTGAEPQGLVNVTGIGSVVGGTNGLAPNWGHVVGLETEVAKDNALAGSLAYCFSPKAKGYLKTAEKAAGTANFVMGEGNELNGYQVATTTQMPDNLTKGTSSGICSALLFGNFTDAIYFLWGGLDLKADETTNGDKGGLILRVFQDFWFAVRHPESFAAMKDALC